MYKHILVPVENSDADRTILQHIHKLARFTHAKLSFIHVADGFGAQYQKTLNLSDSEEILKDQAYLQELKNEFTQESFSVNTFLELGDPVKRILECADREQCDLIAMSTHGHGPIKDFFLGTVASSVRHRTNIPVLLLRVPQ